MLLFLVYDVCVVIVMFDDDGCVFFVGFMFVVVFVLMVCIVLFVCRVEVCLKFNVLD